MFDDDGKRMRLTRWIIHTFALCILLYLGVRHIHALAMAIAWLADLVKPLLIGLVLALILNVPMSFLEDKLLVRLRLNRGNGRWPLFSPCCWFWAFLWALPFW